MISKMKIMDKIVNKGSLVIAGIGLTGMLSGGCAMVGTPQDMGEAIEYLWNAGDTERRRKGDGIMVTTHAGYTVNLHRGASVYYAGRLMHVQELVPPYVGLCDGKYKSGWACPQPIKIRITDLDIFREGSRETPTNNYPIEKKKVKKYNIFDTGEIKMRGAPTKD